jgi:diguanylate cyclase
METHEINSIYEDIQEGNRSEALCRLLLDYSKRIDISFFWLSKQLPHLNNAIDRQIFFNYLFRDQFLHKTTNKKNIEEGVLGYISGLVFENQDNLLELVQNDSLTKLLNRQGYNENIIKHMARHKRSKMEKSKDEAILVFIDVNKFKDLNDNLGHSFGDKALKFVGESIMDGTRTTDLKARYGGDEFILFLDSIRLSEKYTMDNFLSSISLRLNSSLSKKLDKSGKQTNISLSLGIATYDPIDTTSDELLKRADQAMYYAKEHIQSSGKYYHLWQKDKKYIDKDERKGRI